MQNKDFKKMNDNRKIEYLKSLIPKNLPNGMDIVKEGREIGKGLKVGRSTFLEQEGYPTYEHYRRDCIKKNKICWRVLLGLSSLEEQRNGIKDIYEFSKRTGLEINTVQCIPSPLVALPKEYRENAPKPTSYTIDTPEDWLSHTNVAPVQIIFMDHILCCPNSLETTINAIKAGSAHVGLISQMIWCQPGYTDHVQHITDVIKSVGIVSSKKDDYISCGGYLDDGIPGYAMDCVTYIGYVLLEHYIVTTLCGARYVTSYGGLLSEGQNRIAVALAIHELLSTDDQLVMSYINGSTTWQWDHDIDSNYGPSSAEMLLEILAERKYKMGMSVNPVSITEKITVPTVQELLNIFSVGSRIEELAHEWDNIVDFTPIEEIRDVLMEQGQIFFNNALTLMEKSGVNIKDPLEILMMLKNLNPSKFEALFHPNTDENDVVIPFYPTVLGRQTVEMKDKVIVDLESRGHKQGMLGGKKVIVVSGDGHSYGLQLVEGVLSYMGALTINGGVDIDPINALDLADEEGAKYILISVHVGQSLDYARQITQLASQRGKEYHIFMGGKLNAILPGHSESSDVTGLINEAGVYAMDDLFDSIAKINEIG